MGRLTKWFGRCDHKYVSSWYIPSEYGCRDWRRGRAHVWVDQQFDNHNLFPLFGVCLKTIFSKHFLLTHTLSYPPKWDTRQNGENVNPLGAIAPWLATRAGHGQDGSTPHQYRWADVVWAPCCHDCVMGCCGVLVFFQWPLVARDIHILHLGLGLLRARLLGLCCTAPFPLIFLQLRKGPLQRCTELRQSCQGAESGNAWCALWTTINVGQ